MKKYVLIKKDALTSICNKIAMLTKEIDELKRKRPVNKKVYTNEDLRELLQVNDKLIRKYRNEGLLGYHKSGGKYWYEESDVTEFLASHHRCA